MLARLFRTTRGVGAELDGRYFELGDVGWDALFQQDDLTDWLLERTKDVEPVERAPRPDPIPVYAEMGSINPVFLLPGALAERAERIAEGLHQFRRVSDRRGGLPVDAPRRPFIVSPDPSATRISPKAACPTS